MLSRSRLFTIAVAAAGLLASVLVGPAHGQILPAPPAVYLDTTLVAPTGQTITVGAGGDLQGALNAAQPGDVIALQPGAVFTGPFTLPAKAGTGWITVRSATADSNLPAPGTRISPAYASVLPKVVAPYTQPALVTAAGAHHYRFIGVEFLPAAGTFTPTLVEFGSGSETAASALPHDIIVDRCYVHGDPALGGHRGIGLNGARLAVIDSYVSDWKGQGMDTQALAGWNGPGPFKIVDNYLEASGENVMFGGADPQITNLVPSDIEIRHNVFSKPLTWNPNDPSYAGTWWWVKNMFELKNAQRVLADGNVFENNWVGAQNGFGILFTVRNQDGTAPWSVVQDVTFTNNIVRHTASGVNMLGLDDLHPSQETNRVLIRNNLFVDVGGSEWGGGGTLFQILSGVENLTIDHNTGFETTAMIVADGAADPGFTYTNNLTSYGAYGVTGTGTAPGLNTLNTYFPGYVFDRNVLVGGPSWEYPADNFFPATIADVGFVDYAGGNYQLATTSPYHDAATDGTDIGVRFDQLNAAQAGSGLTSVISPDTTPPTVSITTPTAGAVVSGSVGVAITYTDNVGVTAITFAVDGALVGTYSPPTTSFWWGSTTVADGTHTLTVTASDAAGNTAQASVSVTVQNAVTTTPAPAPAPTPTIAITSPGDGSTVGVWTRISVSATDASGLETIQVYGDGTPIGGTISCSSTSCTGSVRWFTKKIAPGAHTLTAVSTDTAGATLASAPVTIYR